MFAVLHVADFPLQAVLRFERDLVAQPVALIGETRRTSDVAAVGRDRSASNGEMLLPLEPPASSPSGSASLVLSCTAAARAAGVEIGQTVPQAMARCADVVLRTVQLAAEVEARAGLLAAALAVTPYVEDTAPGVCTMSVASLAEESREAALQAALEQLEQLGLMATAGLATTPLLALYAAREGCREVGTDLRAVCGSLGERALPALPRQDEYARANLIVGGVPSPRIACVQTGTEREFLRDLTLAVAEPPAEIAEILTAWGVRTLGELTALSKADITLRLGPAGLALWERAAGEVARPLRMIAPPQSFAAEMTLEHEIETLEPLLFLLQRFIDRLVLDLANAGFVAGEMVLGLMLADDTTYTRVFRLPEPTARPDILFRVLHTHLETLHTAAMVRGLSLTCRPVRPLAQQSGLFDSALRDPHGFSETLARVATVVGPDRLGTPVLENTHRPDAVRLVKPAAVVPPMAKASLHPPRGLPLRRYREPLTATVELDGSAPAFVWTGMVVGAVRTALGPWRASGDWWDASRAWRQEAWDVELESSGVYRLLHTPEGWFVEGEYD